jgi:catalase
VLVTDGVDPDLVAALLAAAKAEGTLVEIVAPEVGGVAASDGSRIEAKRKLDGAPSVLFDAVAILVSADGAAGLVPQQVARDFVSDAFHHCKFIAFSKEAMPLLDQSGIAADLDEGCLVLDAAEDATTFIGMCRQIRLWSREQP